MRWLRSRGSVVTMAIAHRRPRSVRHAHLSRRTASMACSTAGDTTPMYQYIDIGKTVFGALSHDTPKLIDPAHATAIDFVRGASWLLGPRVAATATFDDGATLAYSGYDRTQSPLLDVIYAYLTLLRDQNTPNVLALAQELFSNHVSATARLTEDAIEI